MYSTTDFRKGLKIEVEGIPYEILDFQHFKPGKGGALVRTKLSNVLNGKVVDKNFRSGDKVDRPDLETRTMQYLYAEGDSLVFMDLTSYEQVEIPKENTAGKYEFLSDGQECRVQVYNGNPLDIELPIALVLEVIYTEIGLKGDTVSNTTKPATLSTGVVIQVPLFVEKGNMVKVDTRSREYIGRE